METEEKLAFVRMLLAILLGVAATVSPIADPWRAAAFAIPYLLVGAPVLLVAIRHVFHGRLFDEMTLMSAATLGAFALREYPEALAVMVFYQLGEGLQDMAVGKSRRSVAALLALRPDTATLLRDGIENTVSPDVIVPGDQLLVRPGERIPVDAEITAGRSTIDTSAITGESLPRDVAPGDSVYAGTVNRTALLHLRALRPAAESAAARIIHLVEAAENKKAPTERFVTRFARRYTPCVVLAAALLALIPPLLFSASWAEWIRRALVFLVVSCPCALVVSIPLAFFGGIGRASRDGILIKGADALEALAAIRALALDKTGTVTRGTFVVSAVHPTSVSEARLLDLAAAAERFSTHPVALSILNAHRDHIGKLEIADVTELPGFGLRAIIDGLTYYVGNAALMTRIGADWHDCHLGGTVIHLAEGPRYLGHITIRDEIKPETPAAITALNALGISPVEMFTGDTARTARAIAEAAGIDVCRADLLPEQKVAAMESLLTATQRPAAFVGDGINDAPVLARASVGIAMGGLGSDAAIESADVVILDDRLDRLPRALQLARRTLRIVHQNILFILAVKLIILLLGACGLANMWAAVFGDVGVLLLATANASRTLAPLPSSAPAK